MLTVEFRHFADGAPDTFGSGWYVVGEDGMIVPGTPRFDHQASAIRAVNKLLNARVSA